MFKVLKDRSYFSVSSPIVFLVIKLDEGDVRFSYYIVKFIFIFLGVVFFLNVVFSWSRLVMKIIFGFVRFNPISPDMCYM